MSAMADLYTAISDLTEGRSLDFGQADVVRRYVDGMNATYTPANPMITVVNLDQGRVEHMRKLTFEDHFQGFDGYWFPVEVRHCEDCGKALPVLAGGPGFDQPWRLDKFPRCSAHAF